MQIRRDLPELTITEASRFWMNSGKALEIATFVGRQDGKIEFGRMLNNMADKGFIDFKKVSQKKTAPRLYSLNSVIKLATAKVLCASGRSYEFAARVADELVALSDKFLSGSIKEIEQLVEVGSGWYVLYSSDFNGMPYGIRSTSEATFDAASELGNDPEVSCIEGANFLYRLYDLYAEHWRDELYDKGLLKLDRYRGCMPDGTPLNIWQRKELSELERARWKLRVEEYLAEQESKPDS